MLKSLKSTRNAFMALAVSTTALFGMAQAPANAAETINMIAIDGYPERSMWVQEFSKMFIPRVNELLAEKGNYTINWQESYGGAIVKPRGVLEGVKLVDEVERITYG